jgi:Leucine-rich repeat (LRR) protein
MLAYASSAGSKHREVPAVMMDMTNLTFLSLAANVLQELPGTHFTCFTGTKVQILTHKTLPGNISTICKLTHLDVSGNKLQVF